MLSPLEETVSPRSYISVELITLVESGGNPIYLWYFLEKMLLTLCQDNYGLIAFSLNFYLS